MSIFIEEESKVVYVMDRIKKAAEYNPDLIIWQIYPASFPKTNWVFNHNKNSYDVSFGDGLIGAYSNIFKMNNSNAPFISTDLRSSLVPLYKTSVFLKEYKNGLKSKRVGTPLVYPNATHIKTPVGAKKVTPRSAFSGKFDVERRNLDVIGEVCRYLSEKNIKLMIYISPVNTTVLASNEYYDRLYEITLEQSRPYNVPVLNIFDAVPPEYFVDDGHVKEQGDAIVAEKLAEFITSNFRPTKR